MDTHFGSFRDVSFPPFLKKNLCTYEFANFYVKYINNCVCFVSMYVSLYSMYDFVLCNVLCAIVVCVQ